MRVRAYVRAYVCAEASKLPNECCVGARAELAVARCCSFLLLLLSLCVRGSESLTRSSINQSSIALLFTTQLLRSGVPATHCGDAYGARRHNHVFARTWVSRGDRFLPLDNTIYKTIARVHRSILVTAQDRSRQLGIQPYRFSNHERAASATSMTPNTSQFRYHTIIRKRTSKSKSKSKRKRKRSQHQKPYTKQANTRAAISCVSGPVSTALDVDDECCCTVQLKLPRKSRVSACSCCRFHHERTARPETQRNAHT